MDIGERERDIIEADLVFPNTVLLVSCAEGDGRDDCPGLLAGFRTDMDSESPEAVGGMEWLLETTIGETI